MTSNFKSLTTDQVAIIREDNPKVLLLDVRTEPEWEMHHIPGAHLMPMHTLLERIHELDPRRETIVICEHGVRSYNVAMYLAQEAHFSNVATMDGGMGEWNGPTESGA